MTPPIAKLSDVDCEKKEMSEVSWKETICLQLFTIVEETLGADFSKCLLTRSLYAFECSVIQMPFYQRTY